MMTGSPVESVDTDVLIIGGGIAGLVAALRVRRPEGAAAFPARVTILEPDRPGGLLNWGGRNSFHIAGPKYKFTAQDWERLMEDARNLGVEWASQRAISASLAGPIKEVATETRPIKSHAVIIASGAFSMKNACQFRPVDGLVTAFGSVATIRFVIEDAMRKTGRSKLLLFGPPPILELARLLADLKPAVLVEPPCESTLPGGVRLGSVERIVGDPKISGVEYRAENGELHTLDCDTIYADFNAAMKLTRATQFLDKSGLAMENGFVTTRRDMSTNLPGVFAAGDVTGGLFAVSKSIYEGNQAGFSALAYLHRTLYGFEPNLHPFCHGPFDTEIGVFHRRPGVLLEVQDNALEAEAAGGRMRYGLPPELAAAARSIASARGPFRAEDVGITEDGLGIALLFELVRIGVLGVGYGAGNSNS